MKKITAILNGKFTEKLFALKERQIKRALEAAKDNAEKQKEEAAVAYEKLQLALAEEDADYGKLIREMLERKQTIISADETMKAIESIKADLNAEVEVEKE